MVAHTPNHLLLFTSVELTAFGVINAARNCSPKMYFYGADRDDYVTNKRAS